MKTINGILLLLLFLFPVLLNSENVFITVSSNMLRHNCDVIMVSNQHAVLKFYTYTDELDIEEDYTIEIKREIDEELAVTLMSISEYKRDADQGRFKNVTYCNISSGIYIDMKPDPRITDHRTKRVRLTIEGIKSLEEIKIPLLHANPKHKWLNGNLVIDYKKPYDSEVFVLIKSNNFSDFKYYYSNNVEEHIHQVKSFELKDVSRKHRINLPEQSKWHGMIYGFNEINETYCPIYYEQLNLDLQESKYLEIYTPKEADFTNFFLSIENNKKAKGYSFKNLQKSLPFKLPDSELVPGFEELSSKFFKTRVGTDKKVIKVSYFYESDFYAAHVDQPYTSSWSIIRPVNENEEVQFYLPDLPKEVMNEYPCLDYIGKPLSCQKEILSGEELIEDYYWMEPNVLTSKRWLMENNVNIRVDYYKF